MSKPESKATVQKSIIDAIAFLKDAHTMKEKEIHQFLENNKSHFFQLQARADQGEAVAQYCTGQCFFNGIGVTKDKNKGFLYFMKAAEQGHADAQYRLGFCFFWGHGVSPVEKLAKEWLISFPSSNLGMHTLKLCLMSSGGTGFATPFLTFNISLPSSGLGVTT
ncbi:MAG: tetratricopeptide repeat protein [Methylobacter sp.]|nr:tetratricopeptide repeat protein [Methylobacter sp.]MDP2426862.1 tetratricopeptide repeat protein [Methylobacter sp.]MDP3053580.1 tetratricopeptide repeat protein [Methylobacter sp.]MDP3360850.1 tetratricopeptide repeat protein [Methylobacter sp.]